MSSVREELAAAAGPDRTGVVVQAEQCLAVIVVSLGVAPRAVLMRYIYVGAAWIAIG
jgi:hypothetical protein